MNINVNIRAANVEDYKAAIKALMDGAGLLSFDLPNPVTDKERDAAQAVQQLRTAMQPKAAPAKQAAPVQAPVPSAEELPIPAPEAQQQAPVPAQDWAPGGSNQTEDAPKPVTLSELQALGRKVALAGHQDVLAKVLAKYGASNLSSVPEESRAAALADLEAANG